MFPFIFSIVFLVAALTVSWAAPQLLRRAEGIRTRAHPEPPRESQDGEPRPTSTPDAMVWTALDDLQLTRLLTDAARRTNTE